jgi:Rieske Fe-S protein
MTDHTSPTDASVTGATQVAGHGVDRRCAVRALAVAGGAAAAGGLLAGCSHLTHASPSAAPANDLPTDLPTVPTKLTATSAVPVGGGRIFTTAQVAVTQPTAGTFVGLSAICTHAGCIVDTISDGQIFCPCHGSGYSITDGHVTNGPATQGLSHVPITVKDGEIYYG